MDEIGIMTWVVFGVLGVVGVVIYMMFFDSDEEEDESSSEDDSMASPAASPAVDGGAQLAGEPAPAPAPVADVPLANGTIEISTNEMFAVG